jgi:amino acid adenylation domain-containing protein
MSLRQGGEPELQSVNDVIEQSIPERFERIVKEYPDRLALKMGERSLSYGELNRYANRIARAILEKRGSGSEPIALLFDHGIEVIAAIFGVLKAGKFFVALDPTFPVARMNLIAADSQAKLIVTNNRSWSRSSLVSNIVDATLDVDKLDCGVSDENLGIAISPATISSIMYTSGSTGTPKGVIDTHRNILESSRLLAQRVHLISDDRLTLLHMLAYGSGRTNVYLSLLNGASLFPFDVRDEGPEHLTEWLNCERITILYCPVALFRTFTALYAGRIPLSSLRLVHLSGAPISRNDFELYKKCFDDSVLLEISMGSTEARSIAGAVLNKQFAFPSEGNPVGYAPPGKTILILDDGHQTLPRGQVGEIAVKGRNLNPGYWRMPNLTNERYLPDHSDGGGEKVHLTGDLGIMLADGFLIHLGRKDLMVKVRGYRVNIGEVENALFEHPQIKEAGVAAWDRASGDKYLAGYVVPRPGSALNVSELNEFLRNKLPDYMVPSTFIFLDSLPLTNGKLDRSALPKPNNSRPDLKTPYVAPRTAVERKLAQIWAEALILDQVGVDDNFFDLGGSSLAGAAIIARVKDVFGVELPVSEMFASPTLGSLAVAISRQQKTGAKFRSEKDVAESSGKINSFEPFRKEDIEQSIPARFEKIVRLYPDRLAVKAGTRTLKYDDLNRYANQIARAILERRGQGSEPVALLLEHDIDAIAAILGTLKAGKFYVALDAASPCERLKYITENAEARLIVANAKTLAVAHQLCAEAKLDLLDLSAISEQDAQQNLELSIAPDAIASLTYTSGSTGKPKGVIETHRYRLHDTFIHTVNENICAADKLTLFHHVCFASGLIHLYRSLLNGASLSLFDIKTQGVSQLPGWLEEEMITVAHMTPAVFRKISWPDWKDKEHSPLRLIHLSGAPVTKNDLELYKANFPANVSLGFHMGTTETGGVCAGVVDQNFQFPDQGTPVGYPMSGKTVFLRDANGHAVGPMQVGEIIVQSRYLGRGYWRQPNLADEKFFGDSSQSQERSYRTGDLAFMLPDGFIVHLGRKDLMVKVRGYRVNIGEVENALFEHPGIKEAGVVAWDRDSGDKYLAGYLVPRQGSSINVSDVYGFLRKKLPDYMIPSTFVFLATLPLTNGKLNRSALPRPNHGRPDLDVMYVAPRNDAERKLSQIWAEVLVIESVGVDDDFFDLGGNSLAGAAVIARVKDVFGVELPVSELFASPTVGGLSREIARREAFEAGLPQLVQATVNGVSPMSHHRLTGMFSKHDVEQSIPARFDEIVKRFPDRIAIKDQNRTVTYAELNSIANRLAYTLRAGRSKDNEPIGIFLEKGVEQFAAMLGVLKSGKFFVLLDPAWPLVRIIEILNDTDAGLVISDAEHSRKLEQASNKDLRFIVLEALGSEILAAHPPLSIAPNKCAYLVYTSGSTGQPKGVIQTHRTLLHRVMLRTNKGEVAAQDRVALLPSGTSNTISNAFQALLNGAALYPFDVKKEGVSRLAIWLAQEDISVCFISSTLFRSLCQVLPSSENFPELRFLRLRSESAHRADVDLFRKYFSPKCTLVHSLSSSETGPLCEYLIDHDTDIPTDELPVGFTEEDKQILLLDEDGNELGCNRVGEIVVRSRYLSPGYWRRAELNRIKFRSDRFSRGRLYFTGDLGLRLPDGCLIHKGRKDLRVKIRGYGVEIQEVEKVVRSHPAVAETVVLSRDNKYGEARLIAYITCSSDPPTTSELRGFLGQTLPDYMIPAAFIRLEALPLTPNGKVDRKALPEPDDQRPELSTPYVLPRNQVERMLAGLWEDVLGVRPIGINDDFFDLGGDSLKLASLVSRIEQELGMEIAAREVLEAPRISSLGRLIDTKASVAYQAATDHRASQYLVNLRVGSGEKRIFCFPYLGGFRDEYFNFCRISRHFNDEYSFYGLRARGVKGDDGPRGTIKEIAADYMKAILSVQPHGPYFLVGECGGGIPAFETARQLQAAGEKVELLILFDTHAWSLKGYVWRRLKEPLNYRKRLGLMPASWEYFEKRAQLHLKELRRRKGFAQTRYLLDKFIKLPTAVAHSIQQGKPPATGPATEAPAETSRPDVSGLRLSEKDYFIAAHRYRYRPYTGRIVLLVNQEWHEAEPSLGWQKFASGGLDIYPIPGDHDHCVPDNIARVAQIVKECVIKAGVS